MSKWKEDPTTLDEQVDFANSILASARRAIIAEIRHSFFSPYSNKRSAIRRRLVKIIDDSYWNSREHKEEIKKREE